MVMAVVTIGGVGKKARTTETCRGCQLPRGCSQGGRGSPCIGGAQFALIEPCRCTRDTTWRGVLSVARAFARSILDVNDNTRNVRDVTTRSTRPEEWKRDRNGSVLHRAYRQIRGNALTLVPRVVLTLLLLLLLGFFGWTSCLPLRRSVGTRCSSSVFRATLLFLRRSLALFLVFSLSLRSPASRPAAAAAAARAREKGEKRKEREGERDRGEKER